MTLCLGAGLGGALQAEDALRTVSAYRATILIPAHMASMLAS